MKKKRKRVNKNIPARPTLSDMADRLWSMAILEDWDHRCPVCGKTATNAHHLIPRQHQATRYELRNGIGLCVRDHIWNPDVSPHQDAVGWVNWLCFNYPGTYKWYADIVHSGQHKMFEGTKNNSYYCDIIRGFRQYVPEEKYVEIIGKKFAAWLDDDS